jgi:hypothetical protein
MVYPSAAAALLPNGQVLYAGGRKVKYCGQYYCDVRRMLSMARADMVDSA